MLVSVPLVLADVVVGEHRAERLVLVIDLGRHHDVAVAGELDAQARDGCGLLEDLGIEEEPGILLGHGGMSRRVDVGPHGTRGRVKIAKLAADDHRVVPPLRMIPT